MCRRSPVCPVLCAQKKSSPSLEPPGIFRLRSAAPGGSWATKRSASSWDRGAVGQRGRGRRAPGDEGPHPGGKAHPPEVPPCLKEGLANRPGKRVGSRAFRRGGHAHAPL
ncbi:hypothetical protein AAFF_G00239940 [Aldrovandia affinis]|uniref:Uncharacterized protein n=1 Tax=Aldrovandia affinis TaxID=143900 RepID=A0AAD7WTZ0_9TELE|nr:hypothetical protein AAFF_G00239940 [Aldrovandia affinis]